MSLTATTLPYQRDVAPSSSAAVRRGGVAGSGVAGVSGSPVVRSCRDPEIAPDGQADRADDADGGCDQYAHPGRLIDDTTGLSGTELKIAAFVRRGCRPDWKTTIFAKSCSTDPMMPR